MTRILRPCLPTATFVASAALCAAQSPAPDRESAGAEIYQTACAACHGGDGKGEPARVVGFATRLPDFSDCAFSTSEPDADWVATVHDGGRARGLDRTMPAFGDALSDAEIQRVVDYARGFCTNPRWPNGALNLPRALVTGKAFPENEAVVTTAVPTTYTNRVETRFVFERRLGPRSEYEIVVPYNVVKWPGGWTNGLGDVSAGFKHVLFESTARGSIVTAGGEFTFPTGKETQGLGNRLAIAEAFGIYSQRLPRDAFVQVQSGIAVPTNNRSAYNEVFWRSAAGASFTQGRWGRIWSPMLEVVATKELVFEEHPRWDVLPELQVTLSRRQHVVASGGVRLPVNLRTRGSTAIVALLWQWSQGSPFSGW